MGVIDVLRDELEIDCLATEKRSLDYNTDSEYKNVGEHPLHEAFETPKPRLSCIRVPDDIKSSTPSIFKYFLDGSRKTYRLADIISSDGTYLPLIAGQVGVAVTERLERQLVPVQDLCTFKNIIALPNTFQASELREIQERLKKHFPTFSFEVVSYSQKSRNGEQRDPVDLGVAKIMAEMQALELKAIELLARQNLLRSDSMLIVDGALQFTKALDYSQFRNVIGVSKSFRPNMKPGKRRKRRDIGTDVQRLEFAERTQLFRYDFHKNIFGNWYLRIRDRARMTGPLQGVIKAEILAGPEESENGFSADRVNTISQHLLSERSVTPFDKDPRWATHLYPIYLTELYIKSRFSSELAFKGAF